MRFYTSNDRKIFNWKIINLTKLFVYEEDVLYTLFLKFNHERIYANYNFMRGLRNALKKRSI